MFNVRLFCELLSFNLYSNGCVFEFVGVFCASYMNVKLPFYQKRDFCKNVNAAEGNPGVVIAVGLAGVELNASMVRTHLSRSPPCSGKGM